MKKTLCLLSLLFCTLLLSAQKKIMLEKVRVFSTIGPMMNYWQAPEVRQSFISDLRNILMQKHGSLLISDSVTIEKLNNGALMNERAVFTPADSNTQHLYVDVYELDRQSFINYVGIAAFTADIDTTIIRRAKTYLVLSTSIFDANKREIFSEELRIIVTNGETAGIGVAYENFNGYSILATTPRGFTGILQKGMSIVLDTTNASQLLEMKTPQVYMADNFILPVTGSLPKIFVKNQKSVSRFNYKGNTEILRMDEQMYEELLIRGKKKQEISPELLFVLNAAPESKSSDFVYLRQECRDVVRDKNYLVKLLVQINPDFAGNDPKSVFTNFLEGGVHRLLYNKDTVANFMIAKNTSPVPGRFLYLNKISNGADSSSFFAINPLNRPWAMRYVYTITGRISKQDFVIQMGGPSRRLKEFYLNGKMVCVAEGEFYPEKFVMIDPSVDNELLNQLFIIGFCRFFA